MDKPSKQKPFNGKAIYKPKGKAGEYSDWACNFYTGCSNNCDYCYCKRGVLSHVWSDRPRLKKCFKDADDAFRIFRNELKKNVDDLRKSGIFFTFTSDPMLSDTQPLTMMAVKEAIGNGVPVQILTKCADIRPLTLYASSLSETQRRMIAIGFTLTCHDELEPGASRHSERINAMKVAHEIGCRTFASIEPVIDLDSADKAISDAFPYCDLFKVGLMSGGRKPDRDELCAFIERWCNSFDKVGKKVYWKRSVREHENGSALYLMDVCVDADYNMFFS